MHIIISSLKILVHESVLQFLKKNLVQVKTLHLFSVFDCLCSLRYSKHF